MANQDQPNHMWGYWCDEFYTPTEAVRRMYPNLLRSDPVLFAKVVAADTARDAVALHMASLPDDFPYEMPDYGNKTTKAD